MRSEFEIGRSETGRRWEVDGEQPNPHALREGMPPLGRIAPVREQSGLFRGLHVARVPDWCRFVEETHEGGTRLTGHSVSAWLRGLVWAFQISRTRISTPATAPWAATTSPNVPTTRRDQCM